MNPALAPADERFVVFDVERSRCVGVLARGPRSGPAATTGVLIVVGGPQYRVGSHRQFALLARSLARSGFATLRFDYRGMGDSEGEPRSFDSIDADLAAAVDALCRESGVVRVVLWGLCDGASAALMYACADPRVAGIVALNPWARSIRTEASTRLKHYYLRRLFSAEFWRKAASGRIDPRRAAGGLAAAVRDASNDGPPAADDSFLRRMEEGWRRFRGSTLVLLSGRDLTAREFEAWVAGAGRRKSLLDNPRTTVARFPEADHTFSDRASRDAAAATTIEWMTRIDTTD